MFSWGEDCRRGFWLKGSNTDISTSEAGVHHLNISYQITEMSVGHNVLAFVKNNGNAFIMRTNESNDGRRVRGKQKFVKCKEGIEAVSCGDDVVTFLSEKGLVFCVDTTQPPYTPRTLEAFSNIAVAQVSCGNQHSVVLTKDGQVYTWGLNSRGQLGLGRRNSGVDSPQHLRSLSSMPVVQICAGGEQSFVLSVSGGVFSWGRNDCGQLGLGDTKDRYIPTCIDSLNLKNSCEVSCGNDHTVILTKHGAVFTFGSGQFGQLGHNSFQNELRPRLVAELWGAKVIKIACGRNHTLVLTDVYKVYSFGSREFGQLGRGEDSHPSVPLPVRLPQDTSHPQIRSIFAGENCSFATCSSDEDVHRDSDRLRKNTQDALEDLIDNWTSECDLKSWKKIKQEIHRTFSSASCLNKSFLERDKHFKTSSKYHGLNLKVARLTFKKLVKTDCVWEEAEPALLHLLPLLDKSPVGVESLRIFILLNELLHVIQKHRQWSSTKLTQAVASAVTALSKKSLEVLGDWWSSLSSSSMGRFVKVWRQASSVILSYERIPLAVKNLLLVLQYMYNVNSRVSESRRLPESDFCLLINEMFLYEDLVRWRSQSQLQFLRVEPLILCNFPFMLDLQAKKRVFDWNADLTKVSAAYEVSEDELLLSFGLEVLSNLCRNMEFSMDDKSEVLRLNLRPVFVLEDTFKQLAAADHRDYKKPLMVHFYNNLGVDNNLNIKDFFYEVFHEMMSSESELFMFNDSKTLAWFSSKAPEEDERFYLFGVLCGLALYNQAIIYLPFPLVLFKKLLGVKPSLEDLAEFDPSVGESLQYILDYTDGDLEDMYMFFSIKWDGKEVDLDPRDPEKPVTSQNKKEFVDAYVNHAFNASVENVFRKFRLGFFQVCDRELVRLFRPKELQEVLVGKDFHDWEKLKQNTDYEGGYHANHPNIQMFWEVFDVFTENQKKAFLWFVTGFEQVPILGLDNIKMTIAVKHVEDLSSNQYYPESHTCFSKLMLPLYSTKEILQTKLTEALSNNRIISTLA